MEPYKDLSTLLADLESVKGRNLDREGRMTLVRNLRSQLGQMLIEGGV